MVDGTLAFGSNVENLSVLLKKLRHPALIAWLASVVIRALGSTVRCRFVDHSGISTKQVHHPVIWLFWHNRVLLMPYMQRKFCPQRHGVVLTSQSKDGEIIARIMKRFGHDAVRGSSNKRPAAALREMVRELEGGGDVVITPDGPRGPRHVMQPGPIKLAQLSQCPMMPVHLQYDRAWVMKTWDGFLIPKPFTRATLVFAPLVEVPRDLDRSASEKTRREVEAAMVAGADEMLV